MAREAVNLREALTALHPSFDDCPSPCARTADDERPRDLPDFCAECEVRTQLSFFREAAERELARRFDEGACAWGFDDLYADVTDAMTIDRRLGGEGYPSGASALLARCLDILRREQERPERIRAWEMAQRKPNG